MAASTVVVLEATLSLFCILQALDPIITPVSTTPAVGTLMNSKDCYPTSFLWLAVSDLGMEILISGSNPSRAKDSTLTLITTYTVGTWRAFKVMILSAAPHMMHEL